MPGFVETDQLPVVRHEAMNGLVRGRTVVTTIPAKEGSRAGDMLNMALRKPVTSGNHSAARSPVTQRR